MTYKMKGALKGERKIRGTGIGLIEISFCVGEMNTYCYLLSGAWRVGSIRQKGWYTSNTLRCIPSNKLKHKEKILTLAELSGIAARSTEMCKQHYWLQWESSMTGGHVTGLSLLLLLISFNLYPHRRSCDGSNHSLRVWHLIQFKCEGPLRWYGQWLSSVPIKCHLWRKSIPP